MRLQESETEGVRAGERRSLKEPVLQSPIASDSVSTSTVQIDVIWQGSGFLFHTASFCLPVLIDLERMLYIPFFHGQTNKIFYFFLEKQNMAKNIIIKKKKKNQDSL